ncbi:MAG TPA: hypothetical protein VN939_05410 [Chthoniobacterales bacterium]|nr:hypothetical protein [Chthoniobacterales bacterium]
MNTSSSLYPTHSSEEFYVAYLRNDQAKEPLAVDQSIPKAIAIAVERTGRSRDDFTIEEISKERYEKLRRLLG